MGVKGLQVGAYGVCKGAGAHRCRLGRVLNVSALEGGITVHKHGAVTDDRLRVKWHPLFTGEDQLEVVGAGAQPS